MPLDALVVLGCRVNARGEAFGAARRRIERAAKAHRELGAPSVVLSGGKRWHGRTEAEVFKNELVRLGIPAERLFCEERSLNTRQNARYTCDLARERGFRRLAIVSCEWHLARAVADFRSYGFDVEAIGAAAPARVTRTRRFIERAHALCDRALIRLEQLGLLALCLLLLLAGCQRGSPPGATTTSPSASAKAVGSAAPDLMRAILSAEYARRADAIPAAAFTAQSAEVRTAALRALSRTPGPTSNELLLSGLADDAPRALAFAAFGLGRSSSAQASNVSRALALRSASLVANGSAPAERRGELAAIAAALGRVANDEAERTLRGWLAFEPEVAEAAALGLAELAARRRRLEDETFVALLDAADRKVAPVDAAIYAFARVASPKGALEERLIEIATRALSGSSVRRAYAIRALELAEVAAPLVRALDDRTMPPELGAELGRALVHLGDAGKVALGKRLSQVPADAAAQRALLESPELMAWLGVLDALSNEPPGARDGLLRLSAIEIPKQPWLARRAIWLRCGAARLLAGRDIAFNALSACDADPAGRSGRLALLAVLDRGKLSGVRAARFRELAVSSDTLVRQAAVRLLLTHDELDNASELLVRALSDPAPGTVAAAGEVLARRTAAKSADERLSAALVRAYRAHANDENPGVPSALIDAAATLAPLSLASDLERACSSDNANLREHAERALSAMGRQKRCPAPTNKSAEPPRELDHLVQGKLELAFETELGELSLTLDATDAPLAVTRIADLVKSGFYDGIEVHRFVPGFVLQFGDRGGDGYGGSGGPLLRSELGPSRFGALSVGLAESGADSGSSQIFVTLGRFPHLDGNATYLGEAAPGWERLVAGDRIIKARVVR